MADKHHSLSLSYSARAALPSCSPLVSYLLNLMTIKRTNLCLSADVTTTAELLGIAEELGDYICVLKTHADIVKDFSDRTISQLRDIATRKHFLIFEDRKFADIGSTVQKQYIDGPLSIAKWAEFVSVHTLPGPAIVSAMQEAATTAISKYNTTVHTEISAGPSREASEESHEEELMILSQPPRGARGSDSSSHETEVEKLHMTPTVRKHSIVSISTTISTRSEPMSPQPASTSFIQSRSRTESVQDAFARLGPIPYLRACLLLAQMSSADNLLTPEYTARSVQIGRQHPEFVLGFIAQESLNTRSDDNFLTFTPGVKLLEPGANTGDGMGQQYRTPREVIQRDGADIIIVGRGLVKAENRIQEAERYRKEAWGAYEARIESTS